MSPRELAIELNQSVTRKIASSPRPFDVRRGWKIVIRLQTTTGEDALGRKGANEFSSGHVRPVSVSDSNISNVGRSCRGDAPFLVLLHIRGGDEVTEVSPSPASQFSLGFPRGQRSSVRKFDRSIRYCSPEIYDVSSLADPFKEGLPGWGSYFFRSIVK